MEWHELVDDTTVNLWKLDVRTPNVARIYDFLLGGKDNYQADRDAAERVLQLIPRSAEACRENRDFLGRVVRHLAAEHGIRQFLDIGSGLPSAGNVHQVAQQAAPGSRVVYVDYDRLVATHARALLQDSAGGVLVVEADAREPERIIAAAKGLLDFDEPVAVLLLAVLHFLVDEDDPYGIVRALTAPLVPGSVVAVSHITGDATPLERSEAAQQVYAGASAPAVPRPLEAVTRFFDGLDLMPPGVTDIRLWAEQAPRLEGPVTFYGGVGVKPPRER